MLRNGSTQDRSGRVGNAKLKLVSRTVTTLVAGLRVVALSCTTLACAGGGADAASAGSLGPADAVAPRTGGTSAPSPATSQAADIRHLHPAPDAVGAQPTRFEWSAAPQAESYTLRVWNEADVRVISEAGLTVTSIDFPAEYEMPAGTYFWAIVGMRGNQPVAESGLAAFVVRRP